MTIYGRSARLVRRYGPWIVVVTLATVAAASWLERTFLLPALGVGLLLGAGTALIRAVSRGRIRSREDFGRLTGTNVLATIPPTRRTAGGPVLLHSPESPAAESYRYLRVRLQPALRATGTTTILVTSPGDRQGRSTVAANLAAALARAGRDVVLVDADLRRPVLHEIFEVPGDYGLTTLLDGDATVSEVLAETAVPRLHLVPAGHRTSDHVDLLQSPQLARVLRAVQKHCDVVVLDAAAVLSAADGIALAGYSDQVLLVGDYRRTSRASVRRAVSELSGVVDGNLSAVLVNAPKSAGGLMPYARELAAVSAERGSQVYSSASVAEGSDVLGLAFDSSPAEETAPVPAEDHRETTAVLKAGS